MKLAVPAALIALCMALAACERKAPDDLKPKTSSQSSGSLSTPSGQSPNDARTANSK
jgi:hypothetical protein